MPLQASGAGRRSELPGASGSKDGLGQASAITAIFGIAGMCKLYQKVNTVNVVKEHRA